MAPKQVIIIRHAEKPADVEDPNLSPAGAERAKRLAEMLPQRYGKPDHIFAAAPSKHSNRPVLTAEPLSNSVGVRINSDIADQDYPVLSERLTHLPKYQGKVVLICWHHGCLPDLAHSFGVAPTPPPWNDAVFDRVWIVKPGAQGTTLKDDPQKLMPGDSPQ